MNAGRILMVIAFVAAAARLLLDLPARVPYALAASFALVLAGERFRTWWRLRKLYAKTPLATEPPEWVQCEARRDVVGSLYTRCDLRAGHVEHEHESAAGFRWMDAA